MRQWKEMEAWKLRYMFLPKRQLQVHKFIMGEIGKEFAYHSVFLSFSFDNAIWHALSSRLLT
jgi:hypothetical protein